MMRLQQRMKHCFSFFLWFFPLALLLVIWLTYPFTNRLVSQTVSLTSLTPVQKSNIDLAILRLNGTVITPGAEFSFNRVVGPRTESRGYGSAPSYIGTQSMVTEGGGICLVSSTVYQLALKAGLQIEERVPHLRTVRSVLPGLDATVWYGQADLRFKNTLPFPIQMVAERDGSSVTVSVLGPKTDQFKMCEVERIVTQRTSSELLVEVLRTKNGAPSLLTRDNYRLSNQRLPGSLN